MKIEVNIRKKHLVVILLSIGVLGSLVFVLASLGSIPNPGHPASQLQKCSEGEILKIISGVWDCASSGGSGGSIVLGITTTTYNGNMGGYAAANTNCVTEFGSGARMCATSDFTSDGFPPYSGAFYNSFLAHNSPGSTTSKTDCNGWTSTLGSASTISTSNTPNAVSCSVTLPLLCCRNN